MRTKLDPSDTVDRLARVLGVRKNEDTYDAGCSCGFISRGWEKKRHAEERLEQHAEEHASGTVTPELVDFMADNGLGNTANLTAFKES